MHQVVRCAAQADAGAQAVQIFDSWASELAPQDFDVFSGPYIRRVMDSVRGTHPDLQLILYISGSGGLMERMAGAGVDVISVDHRVDLRDALQRIGPDLAVQVRGVDLYTLDINPIQTQRPWPARRAAAHWARPRGAGACG